MESSNIHDVKSRRTHLLLVPFLGVYLALALPGIRYGLPANTHLFPYNCDETMWVMARTSLSTSKNLLTNPKIIQPTLYLWTYIAAFKVADRFGYFQEKWVPSGQIPSRFIFARVYLVGRYLQILFGLVLLSTLFLTAKHLYGLSVAALTTGLMTLCPGLVGVSHFSSANLQVTMLAFFSLALLLEDLQHGSERKGLLRSAAFIAGFACATKYSAFPLVLPLLYASWMKAKRPILCVEIVSLSVIGFALGCPYSWITPMIFVKGFKELSAWLQLPIPGFLHRVLFPIRFPLPYCLGPALSAASLIAVLWAVFQREKGTTLLVLWLAGLLAGTYRCGAMASPARLLIAAPALVLLVSRMLTRIYVQNNILRPLLGICMGILLFLSLLTTLTIVHLHNSVPLQVQASGWIWTHIKRGTTVGVVDHAFFWTPDIIYPDSPDLPTYRPPYPIKIIDLTPRGASAVEYLLIAQHQRGGLSPSFLAWLDSGRDFALVQEFKRILRFKTFNWDRPETPFNMSEDDIWAYSLAIYRRRAF